MSSVDPEADAGLSRCRGYYNKSQPAAFVLRITVLEARVQESGVRTLSRLINGGTSRLLLARVVEGYEPTTFICCVQGNRSRLASEHLEETGWN